MENVFKLSGIADECSDSIYEQVETHKKLGWKYIELRNVNRTTIDTMDDALFDEVFDVLKKNDVKVSCLASDIGKLTLGDEKKPFDYDVNSLGRLIQRAKRLDCSFIRVMAYNKGNKSDEAWRDEGAERLKVLSDIAKKNDIYLALENCVGWHADSGKKMAELLEKIGSDNCVCLYDTGNPSNHHGISSWEYYSAVKDYVRYIHVKDGTAEGKLFVYPGEGVSDVRRILESEYKRGYKGFVSIEPHMSTSAHLPGLGGTAETSRTIYAQYGEKLNVLVKEILSK